MRRWVPMFNKNSTGIYYMLFSTFVGIGSLGYLLLIPSDAKNHVLFGYSVLRLTLVGGFVLLIISSIGLFTLAWMKETINHSVKVFLSSGWIFWVAITTTIFGILLFVLSFYNLFPNQFLVVRLRPEILYITLLAFGLLPYHLVILKRRPWLDVHLLGASLLHMVDQPLNQIIRFADTHLSTQILSTLVLFIAFPLLFYTAFSYAFPANNGGLYTLMAEEINRNNFALPNSVPYYAQNGLPFAYPPLGFYLMALVDVPFFL